MEFRTKKKIFVVAPPATGHINPVCCVVNELCKDQSLEVVFYSDEMYRELIEKTGATYRAFSQPTFGKMLAKNRPITEGKLGFEELLHAMIDFSYDILPQLLADTENDEPDLIIYDGFFFPVKFLIEVINSRAQYGRWNHRVPKTAQIVPNFPASEKMVNDIRKDQKVTFWSMLSMLNVFKRQAIFSWWYGISIYNPIGFFMKYDSNLNIVAVAGELQPNREEFDETFKFVGPCVSEEARSVEIKNDPELKAVLDLFPPKGNNSKPAADDFKLVYLSLGTVFTSNLFVFEKAIEAIKGYDKKPGGRKIKSSQLRVIMSVGEQSLELFRKKASSGEFVQPSNIVMRPKVPQLEVLKRADLFITHCGMNSTTETIKYGVPVVAIPIDADQPMNAKRICDQLSFGVRLEAIKFTADELADAIDEVLSEPKYLASVGKMAKEMGKYNGSVEGAKLIRDYLNKK